jgi:acyl-CoA dehydrogenase
VVAARVASHVVDRAIQIFGAAGLSQDFPLAYFYTVARLVRLADGPDEVHLRTVARQELKRRADCPAPEPMLAGQAGVR